MHLGSATAPDLVLEGDAPPIMGLLSGMIKLAGARELGLRTEGSTAVLRRLRYRSPAGSTGHV